MKSFCSIALLLTVISSLSHSGSVNAGVITLYATHQTIAAGGTGSFDILLRNDLGSDVDISSFDTIMEFTAGSGLTFTSVDELVAAPYSYIFGSIMAPPLGNITNPSVLLSDTHATSQTVTAGQTVGLGRVFFTVDPTTPAGDIPIIFSSDSNGYFTHIYDSALNELPVFLTGGLVTVPVPEPSHVLLLTAAALLTGRRLLRHRRQSPSSTAA